MSRYAAILLLVIGTPAAAAGLRDLGDAWLLPPWPPSPAQQDAAPAWRGWCAAGSGRLYEMPELPLHGLDVGFGRTGRRATWFGRVSWQLLGEDLYRSDLRRLRLGRYGAWRTALDLEQETVELGGQDGPVRFAADLVLGRAQDLGPGIRLAGDLHVPLTAPPRAEDLRVLPVARVLLGTPTAALAVAWDRQSDGTPLLGGELALFLAPRASLLLRFDGGSSSLGPGLVVRWGGFLVRTSHVVHPALGVSHRFQLVSGAACGRWPQPGP